MFFAHIDEIDRQRYTNEIFLKDKIVKIKLLDFLRNIKAKYTLKSYNEKSLIFKKEFKKYQTKMRIYCNNNNIY
jgi:adenine-specific DNA methylase